MSERWRAFFHVYDADEPLAGGFRARQLQALLRFTPLAGAINLINVVVVAAALWSQAPRAALVGWALVVIVMAGLGVRGWWHMRDRPPRHSVSVRTMRRAALQATALGLVWGLLPALTFPDLDATGRFFVGVVVTGMLCAGGFALSSVPWAATGYVLTLGAGCTFALLRWPDPVIRYITPLLGVYTLTVLYSVWNAARTLGARLVAEAEAERQREVIGLLLRDFEDHASDLLWELDARGRFVRVSPRLAEVLAVPLARMSRLKATRVLWRHLPPDEPAQVHWQVLRTLLARRTDFRDQVIQLQRAGTPSWWSLSARPLRDARGQFAGWRGVATDVTERQLAHQRLHWMAHNDSLTGLMNRVQFHERLEEALEPARLAQGPVALLTIDLDDFKQVNDTQGHAAGDALLRGFARRVSTVARRSDALARLGGDEFALLVSGVATPETLKPMVQRLRAVLKAPPEPDEDPVVLRASIGIAFAPADAGSAELLLQHSDIALYAAKRAGGDCAVFFERPMAADTRRRNTLDQALRGALARAEFRLVYQPLVDARDGRVNGFEALLRWRHPSLGDVSPGEFIPVAEALGLMPGIGTWVLQEACGRLRSWPAGLRISINVSAKQLADPALLGHVREACEGLEPRRIVLEVTESALIDDPQAAAHALEALRALGLRVALDDFGTGYSSLAYLRNFQFDGLKIDQSFVRDIEASRGTGPIIDAIIAMARSLDMYVVAEGVETVGQAAVLRHKGCQALQGYLISRPLELADVPDFLERWRGIGAGEAAVS